MTLQDLCFKVCTVLDAAGARAVLTGGSAAAFYAPEAYQSDDADFVIVFGNSRYAAEAVRAVGFTEQHGIYRCDEIPYTIEFPPGPLMIGCDYIKDFASIQRGNEVLHVLHPTDCVRDRLLWYYHYSDYSALSAAVGIAKFHEIDMKAIRAWSVHENASDKFDFFERQVTAASTPRRL